MERGKNTDDANSKTGLPKLKNYKSLKGKNNEDVKNKFTKTKGYKS